MDQAASSYQSLLRHVGERSQNSNLDRCLGLCAGRHRQKTAQSPGKSLSNPTNLELDHVRAHAAKSATFQNERRQRYRRFSQPIESLRLTLDTSDDRWKLNQSGWCSRPLRCEGGMIHEVAADWERRILSCPLPLTLIFASV